MHPRRKWSDWSECSMQCKKTRHRLYCDDILASMNRSSKLAGEQLDPKIKPPTRLDEVKVKRDADKELRRRARRHSHLPDSQANNNDDDDYADEGDEEGESPDSCDKVEASKTFQEINCRGGQCRLPFVDSGPPVRLKQPPGRAPEQDLLFRPAPSPHQSSAPLWNPAGVGGGFSLDDTGANSQQPAASQASGRLPSRHPTNVTSLHPLPEGAGIGNDSSPARASLPVPIWTRQTGNLWPQQLFAAELGPQANLIQWTILIGALVSIVLLIMLTLRKLFVPSYHWMLAKQTLKSSAIQSCAGPEECGHGYYSSPSTTCPSLILTTSSRKHHADDTRRPPQVRPHMVNSSGQAQLIKSDLLEFNTDHLDTHAEPLAFMGASGARMDSSSRAALKDRRSFCDLPGTSAGFTDTSHGAAAQQAAAVHVFQNKSYVFNQWLDSGAQNQVAPTQHTCKSANTSDKSSSSISSNASASDSPSLQSTTAQLISNPASSSFEHSQDNLLDNNLPQPTSAQSAENSPAGRLKSNQIHGSIMHRPPHYKSTHHHSPLVAKSQPNSPLQSSAGSQVTPADRHFISGARLTTFSGHQQTNFRPDDCIAEPEYTQPAEPPKPAQESRRLLGLNQNDCCEIIERHFYEEIVHHKK